jgi:hypothetical protein
MRRPVFRRKVGSSADGLTPDDDATISVPDLIKIYRADHLFRKYELCVVPLASAELEANFGKQVIVRCDAVWVFLMPATMYTNQER